MLRPLSACLAALVVACASPAPATLTPAPAAGVSALAPGAALTPAQRAWVDRTLASLSLRERAGQMVMVWVLGDYTNADDSTFAEVRRWIVNDGIGGVSMSLGTPIEVAAKLEAFQKLARVPLLASSDLEPALGRLEGAVFSHYLMESGGATVFPTAMAIAATGRDQDAYDVGQIIGREARAVGIHVNFAPTVDVNNNPQNPVINTRSFGEDAARVARLSALFVQGSQAAGTMATAKHFPGHGDTDVDSHAGLPVVSADWARFRQVELVPFRAAIDAGAALVMSAHIALPALEGDSTTPATLAPRIMTGLLRDSLGFRGVAITDALTMDGVGKGYGVAESTVLAIKAGADILLKPSDPTGAIDAIVAAVERGELSRERIDASVRRVLELKARAGVAFNRFVSLDSLRRIVGAPAHRAAAHDIARRAVTLLRDRGALVPSAGKRTLLIQYMPETELRAGRAFAASLRSGNPSLRVVKLSPSTAASQLDALAPAIAGAERVVLAAYVRRIEGEGRPAIPSHIAEWMAGVARADSAAAGQRLVFVAFGNPYLLRQLPAVGSYLVTYGVGDALERAAADAIGGRARITGTTPVSLPGFFSRGDGIQR
ncbi:MAG TPA: glycoside hydrolase family 3 N-terminal domain-containing protein [Gemmatimonadaceae bacterium]|nr:glycoside hydrolase family 3 N-terminal domain-containing protein [Gemmatimonadaceae bacterium]HPV73286.1 glycoside hydrolase family 3 N-terminal domain-containing protein [Gemmatimonadaceae bacterium]